jgi:hypothetical protein
MVLGDSAFSIECFGVGFEEPLVPHNREGTEEQQEMLSRALSVALVMTMQRV